MLSAGLVLCLPSLLSHLPDLLPVSWTAGSKGTQNLVGKELLKGVQNQGPLGLATGIIFKSVSLFVILIRDVIDCG